MEWIKLDLRIIRSELYVASDPIRRATWLNLLAYCADKENGGTIKDCDEWPDRMWQQLCGVTKEEVELQSLLWKWDGSDLTVESYPVESERLVRTRRESGSKGGASSKPEANGKQTDDFASTEQSRVEQSRADKSRADQRGPGCKNLRMEEVDDWLESQNGKIPDLPRAKALARELLAEMAGKNWRIDGQPVANPMGLVVHRLKKDGAYKP